MNKTLTVQARLGDEEQDDLYEIVYYIKLMQPLGMPLPTVSDAVRYAIRQAAANIRIETGRDNGNE